MYDKHMAYIIRTVQTDEHVGTRTHFAGPFAQWEKADAYQQWLDKNYPHDEHYVEYLNAVSRSMVESL